MIESRVSSEYDGNNRTLYKKVCTECCVDFWVPKHRVERTKTCSLECRGKSAQNRIKAKCAWCGKEHEKTESKAKLSKSGLLFCSRSCKDEAQQIGGLKEIQPAHYGTGKFEYRTRAFRHYKAECSKCGYNEKKKMLDVDHIDSNRENNELDNLQVLCVWCHAEKTRASWPDE